MASGHGLVLVTCSPTGSMAVAFIDPTTGRTTAQEGFPRGTGQVGLDCGPNPTSTLVRVAHLDLRCAFDSNYQRLAILLPGANEGSDAGYELAGGSTVDIAKGLPGGNGGLYTIPVSGSSAAPTLVTNLEGTPFDSALLECRP